MSRHFSTSTGLVGICIITWLSLIQFGAPQNNQPANFIRVTCDANSVLRKYQPTGGVETDIDRLVFVPLYSGAYGRTCLDQATVLRNWFSDKIGTTNPNPSYGAWLVCPADGALYFDSTSTLPPNTVNGDFAKTDRCLALKAEFMGLIAGLFDMPTVA